MSEPFAYGIQAPIGSVTPLFHRREDAEDFIAKLTDSREQTQLIPLYRAPVTSEAVLDRVHTVLARNYELQVEIAMLREAVRRYAEQDATLSVQGGSVTVTMDATLTDAEREALEAAIRTVDWQAQRNTHAATLRHLLERTKTHYDKKSKDDDKCEKN